MRARRPGWLWAALLALGTLAGVVIGGEGGEYDGTVGPRSSGWVAEELGGGSSLHWPQGRVAGGRGKVGFRGAAPVPWQRDAAHLLE